MRDLARFYHALLGGRLLTPELRREALAAVGTGQPGRGYNVAVNAKFAPEGVEPALDAVLKAAVHKAVR